MAQYTVCYVCNEDFLSRTMRLTRNFPDEKVRIAVTYRGELQHPPLEINNNSRVCFNCDLLLTRDLESLANPEHLRLKVLKQRSTDLCMICHQLNNNMHRLSVEARVEVYLDTNIYIPLATRICLQHLDEEGFLLRNFYVGLRCLNRPYTLPGIEISRFFNLLREAAVKGRRNYLDPDSLTNEDYTYLTSLSKTQFNNLHESCLPVPEGENFHRITRKSLFIFCCKMRHGLTDDYLKILFNYDSRQGISMLITRVRTSMMMRFVPENIGLQAITRAEYIAQHVTPFANALYNDNPDEPKAIAIVDGTYSYIEKSGNYRALRQSYSVHKGRHLVKPIMVNAPNGYILDIQGPYFTDARNNDASILIHQFENDINDINEWFQEGDIFIVDRGYRDAVQFLQNERYNVHMPPVNRGNQQLTTEMANRARMVTMQRWVVEARNGHEKSIYKFLDGLIPVAHVLHLREFYLICGSMINKYRVPLLMPDKTVALAREIRARLNDVNVVQALVEEHNLARRNTMWERLNQVHVPDFPRLHLQHLRRLTLGPYQIELAPSYVQDKFEHESSDVFELDLNRDIPGFIRIRIYSRFRNATRYQLWICFRADLEENDRMDDEGEVILGYYCTCKAGARTLGCCAHVASIVWYLGWARHQQNVKYPSAVLLRYILDAGNRLNNNEPQEDELIVDVEE